MTKKPKIFITRRIDRAKELLLKAGYQVNMNPSSEQVLPRKKFLASIKGMDAVLSLLTDKMNGEAFDAAGPQLKVVANYAVGYDNVDCEEAKRRGVVVGNTPGTTVPLTVAEHTLALLLSVARRIVESDRFVRAGKYHTWVPDLLLSPLLAGKTLGIIGLGRIGKEVARRAMYGLGMNVIYFDAIRSHEFEKEFGATYKKSVEELLPLADAVTLHTPLLPSTYHLMNAKRFGVMKKTAYLINTARGPVVEEAALVQALKKKTIAGVGLDVYEFEPKVHPYLLKASNVVLTPHTGSATYEVREEMSCMAAQNIIAVLEGRKAPYSVTL